MKKNELKLLRLLFALSDLAILNVCLFIGFYLSNKYAHHLSFSVYRHNIISASIFWLLCAGFFRLYSEYTIYKLKDIYRATWRAVFLYCIIFQIYMLIGTFSFYPKEFILSFYAFLIVGFLFSRYSFIAVEKLMKFNFNDRKADVLAIASIGGHWIELLRLMPVFKDSQMTFISNKENLKETVKGHKFYTIPDANRRHIFQLIKCCFVVFWHILFIRPQVIITTGAAPGLLGIFIGRIFGIKTIWIDSIANAEKLSLSGYIAIKIADRVYTQWEHLAAPNIIYSGNIFH